MKLRRVLLVVICILLFAGCAKKDTEKKGNSNPTQAATATKAVTATQAPTPTIVVTNTKPTKKIDIRIGALKGPTAIAMVKLMDDTANKTTANRYKFTIAGTPDEISAGLIKGDYDIAAIPCNLASVLYNRTKGQIKVAGINTLGVLYIVENGKQINSVKDLKGKTIYSTGLGTTPQYTLNYILKANGLDPQKDVKVEYKSEATEVAAILSKSKNAIAMLPQPYVTAVMMQNKNIRISLSVADEWEKVNSIKSTIVTGVFVVRSDFLKKNKAAVNSFLGEYYISQNFVNARPDIAATMVEKYGIFKAAPMKKAIPYCNITYIQGSKMKEMINGYLRILANQNIDSIGGKMPDDNFYYLVF